MNIKRILLSTDFSSTANLALEQAIILAAKYDAELVVLHARLIHEDDPAQLPEKLAYLELAEDQIEGELYKYIEGCTNRAGNLAIQHDVIRGYSAHSAILSYLNEHQFDLIVLGTHGRSNLQHLLLGSVAEKIVRYAPCPVLTISRDAQVKKEFHKIVVPFDFSDQTMKAVHTAIDLAEDAAKIELLYVFEKDVHPTLYEWGMASALEMMPDVRSKAERKMDELIRELPVGNYSIRKIIVQGAAYKKIAEHINQHDADLVIMATKGLVGLDRFLLGSTTEQVIRAVHRPILTVKEKNII